MTNTTSETTATPVQPIQFYGFPLSGHSHRVELLLRMMKLPFNANYLDLANREQKSQDFLKKNPFGQVPVIDDNGIVVWDSGAVLVYLASKYGGGEFLPTDAAGRAEVQRWLSVAAGQVVNGPMAARINLVFGAPCDMEKAHSIAHNLYAVLENFLSEHKYLAVNRLTIADLAMYPYIAHSPEGGIDLNPYPQLRNWLRRIESAPGFVAMKPSKTGLWAE